MKNVIIIFILLTIFNPFLTAQSGSEVEKKALIAMTSPDYPVTPGDVYELLYSYSSEYSIEIGTMPAIITNDYTLNLAIFGKINVRGLTFNELKAKVESLVADSINGSNPQFFLKSPGAFMVAVKGEVKTAGKLPAWGLASLLETIKPVLKKTSSMRNVKVISASGNEKTYDLFAATKFGEFDQNPRVSPGDTIIISQVKKGIEVKGEVMDAGQYQILESDTLNDVIHTYCGGLTPIADKGRVKFTRIVQGRTNSVKTFFVDLNEIDTEAYEVHHLDQIEVFSIKESLPIIFLEGPFKENTKSATIAPIPFAEGEVISALMQMVKEEINIPLADLENSYIVRKGQLAIMPVNLEDLLYRYSGTGEIELQDGDRIVIPMRQYFVIVTGAVGQPNGIPYVPNKTWEYYVDLCGGFHPQRHSGTAVTITDRYGNKKSKVAIIEPEDRIYAPYNNPVNTFKEIAPVVTITLGVILTGFEIYQIIDGLNN